MVIQLTAEGLNQGGTSFLQNICHWTSNQSLDGHYNDNPIALVKGSTALAKGSQALVKGSQALVPWLAPRTWLSAMKGGTLNFFAYCDRVSRYLQAAREYEKMLYEPEDPSSHQEASLQPQDHSIAVNSRDQSIAIIADRAGDIHIEDDGDSSDSSYATIKDIMTTRRAAKKKKEEKAAKTL